MKKNETSVKTFNIPKITVKHFVNTTLKQSSSIVSMIGENGKIVEFPPLYPLYIKITFRRMTTQVKSIVYDDFATIEDAYNKHNSLMKMESRLITDIIAREFRKVGDKFKLKGIAEKIKPYNTLLYDFFSESYFKNEYKRVIIKSRTMYMRLLLSDLKKITPKVYFEAALKLLDNTDELAELNAKLEILEKFQKSFKHSKKSEIMVIDWVYGRGKERFTQNALEAGISFNEIVKIVAEIDKQIETIK